MLGFKDFWKKKNDKNFYTTKDDKPPFPIEVEPEDKEPTPENDVPTKVSDYISSKNIR